MQKSLLGQEEEEMSDKKKISFWATETKKVPTEVKFKTKEGDTVSFKATKIIPIQKKVSFTITKKKK